MQVQQSTEINISKTRQPEAKPDVNGVHEMRKDSSFKEQLNKQVDHSKQQGKSEHKYKNQNDSEKAVVHENVTSESPSVSEQVPAESQGSRQDNPQAVETSANHNLNVEGKLVDVDIMPTDAVMDSTLPPQGNLLPASEIPIGIESELVKSSIPVNKLTALSSVVDEPDAIVDQLRQDKLFKEASISLKAEGQTPGTQEPVFNTQVAYKAVSMTDRSAGLAERQGPVISDMPASEVITQSTRMQQVPLTTAINATVANAQSVNVPTVSGAEFTTALNTASTAAATSTAASTLNTAITTGLQNPQWSQKVTEQDSFMLKGGFQQAEIKLNPAHLGPMEIKLTVNDDQANVNFVAQHAPVRDALDAAIPRLREMLEQQGLNLADVDVSTQSQQRQDEEGKGSSQGNMAKVDADDTAEQADAQHITVNMDSGSGVSVFA